jgi:hypothetical protein
MAAVAGTFEAQRGRTRMRVPRVSTRANEVCKEKKEWWVEWSFAEQSA